MLKKIFKKFFFAVHSLFYRYFNKSKAEVKRNFIDIHIKPLDRL